MPTMSVHATASDPWYLVSLRPSGGHAPLRRAAARRGAQLLAASPWRLQRSDDAAAGQALARALAAPAVIFTSPAAVAAAQALAPLRRPPGAAWMAVGAGTARALQRHGVAPVHRPARMDSEGLLALPALAACLPGEVGLVTAPGGRGVLTPALEARGARVVRADVYRRVALALRPATLRRLAEHHASSVLALSSGEALLTVLPQLPPPLARAWRARPVVAASERLAALALAQGFVDVHRSAGPQPGQLAAAAAALMTPRPPR